VEKAARDAGATPQEFTDRVSQNFRDLARQLDISNDDFIRTTEPRHKACCAELWKRMAARKAPNGESNIYLGKYAGWYAVRDEAFYGEDELTTGPDGRKRAPSGAPRSSGSRSRATSSACRRGRTGCSSTTRRATPSSSRRRRGATR
jgi:methionyl-tRNA synthetase